MSGIRIVYNHDATSTVVAGETIVRFSTLKRMRRPLASKRYRMKRARRHAQVVNWVVYYFRKLGFRGDELSHAVRHYVDTWHKVQKEIER